MEVESCVPPGFRFHPTEEELVGYYLTRKVASQNTHDIEVIADVDLYRIEPWDLQDRCKYGHEDQNEWYFFSHKDKKYPTGTRTNRATAAGFWKATGRDKAVVSKSRIIGMRKTLVFYQGRAPNGRKSDWIMHEYRLQSSEHGPPQEEGWVVCRAFKKPIPNQRQPYHAWSNPTNYYIRDHDQLRLMPTPFDTTQNTHLLSSQLGGNTTYNNDHQLLSREQELESKQAQMSHLFELPQLDSPGNLPANSKERVENQLSTEEYRGKKHDYGSQFIDWKALDRLLGSQLNESTSSSNSNLNPITLDYEGDTQNINGDHFLNSFPN